MKKVKTVAIIDDDDIYQYTIKKTIESTKLVNAVVTFADGQEAIDFFTANLNEPKQLPDLVFLDLNMPIIDGWQFLEQYISIREKIDKEIAIYVISSSTNPDDIIQAKNITAVSDYIVKPIALEKFTDILAR